MKNLEWDLLSYLYADSKKIEEAQDILAPKYFLEPKARLVYESMIELSDNEVGMTISLLAEKCKKRLPEVLWHTELVEKFAEYSPVDIKYISGEIRNSWTMKKYNDLSIEMADLLETETNSDNVTKLIEDRLDAISLEVGEGEKSPAIKDVVSRAISEYDRRAKIDGMIGLDTGFPKLNKRLHGLMRGCTIIMAARPGVGKTAWMINLIINMSEKGFKGANFSLEMKDESLCFRMLSVYGGIDYESLQNASLDDKEIDKMIYSADKMSKMPVTVYDDVYTFEGIVRKMRKEKRVNGLDYVILDYLQLVDGKEGRSRHEEVGAISKRLHQLSQELDIAIVVLAQLSRKVEERNDKRPMLSDLGESGSIERDADVVMFLYNDSYYTKDPATEPYTDLIVSKNRYGKTGTIGMMFDKDTQRFRER